MRDAASGRARRALLLGPLWAAGSGRWTTFWVTAWAETAALCALAFGVANSDGPVVVAGVAGWLAARGAVAFAARRLPAALRPTRLACGGFALAALVSLSAARVLDAGALGPLAAFPASGRLTAAAIDLIESAVNATTRSMGPLFGGVTLVIQRALDLIEIALVGTPWPLVMGFTVLLSWRVAGWRTAAFTLAALLYLGLFGFWERSMTTLAMVFASVLLCALIGLPLGIGAAKSRRLAALMDPILDTMQTMPSFVYLIPAVAFFSIGKPPGVIATVIFALPPMVRLTALGIRQVPPPLCEAALAFGATPAQLLLRVELPIAVPSIMTGINQAIMMSLSMVVVAALIGAGGLGTDVIRSLRNIETGNGILVGFAIVACAMMLDRIVQGSHRAQPSDPPADRA